MQPATRPKHHANSSRSLFQNPWMAAESTAAPPSTRSSRPTPTARKSTLNGNYWPAFPASLQIPTLERVRADAFASHPHPPVKVVKPDWGVRSTLTSTDSEPSLKATWLGHAVRRPICLYTDTLTRIHPEFHRRVPSRCDRPARRTRSRPVRSHLLGVRWTVSLGWHSPPPASSLHSSGTTRFPIRGLLP